MDGFVNQADGFASFNGYFDQRGVRAMGYYNSADLPYYYFLATQFATSDRFFSPLQASTPPNRLYALGGSSFGTTKPPTTTFNKPNIFQRLEEAGISWKIYYTDKDSNGQGLSRIWSFQPWASQHASKIVPMSQYFTDLNNGTLPQVALLESGYGSGRDEHPGGTINGNPNSGNQVQRGAFYISTLLNPLMKSSAWKDSVFFFTFDEGGGMYDHVVPPFNAVPPDDTQPTDLTSSSVPDGFDRYGFRLPFFVVSPYVKKHYVSHTPADLTAILRFIEDRFNLTPLTRRDAAQPDMREFFNFSSPSWPTPPANIPVQPTTGACNYSNIPE
jgi:phospholipase C